MLSNGLSNDTETKWFNEADLPYIKPGIQISIEVKEVLHDEKTEYCHVQVFDTLFYGKMLAIDGIIQVTEHDEFIYHEMMVLLPSLYAGNVENVLIIGGGDGGAVKQALKLPHIQSATLVEIDKRVTEITQQYIPSIADKSLSDPRVKLEYTDGKAFLQNTNKKFDLIVLDLTDPVPDSPAEGLFEVNFYKEVSNALSPTGVISVQCGSLLFQPDEWKLMQLRLKNVFKHVQFHSAVVPSYQLSSFGFLIASNDNLNLETAVIEDYFHNLNGMTSYLSPEIVLATKTIPPYINT